MNKIYIYWWYSGGEYLFRGAFSTKEKALEHLDADWASDVMRFSKRPYVQEIEMDVPNVIQPYDHSGTIFYPKDS